VRPGSTSGSTRGTRRSTYRIVVVAELEKVVWTDGDFDQMGWHDATIHGFGFVEGEKPWLGRLMLDIDYITEWIAPEPPSPYLSFRVAPATLVFEEAVGIDLHLSSESVTFGVALQILSVRRSRAQTEGSIPQRHDYRIQGSDFELRFAAARFRQCLRARPVHARRQSLSVTQRGLPSFATDVFDLPE
jgi:hypothetical protein